MPAAISTLGYGTLTGGTYLVPVSVLADCQDDVVGIKNYDGTNWAYLRPVGGTQYTIAGPGETAILAGGKSAGRLKAGAVEGYAAGPNATGSASTGVSVALTTLRPD